MDLSDYQRRSALTDQLPSEDRLLPLVGLGGEVGQLMAEYKKRERDKQGYRAFRDEVEEELGDVLWYAAALARRNDLDLAEIAAKNLDKTRDLFDMTRPVEPLDFYDDHLDPTQQLPRRLTVTFVETDETSKAGEHLNRVRMFQGSRSRGVLTIGAPLDDNSEHADDYRYHDIFHLAHMAVLGWSPVLRKLLDCKRRDEPATDRIQDGGRAAAIEEGVTAYVFSEATEHTRFATADRVPPAIVKMCMKMTQHLEVASRSRWDWQLAILRGYSVFREVVQHRGGVVTADLHTRTLTFDGPISTDADEPE
jgi:NTP pyrophosphatase (non-canonical NTP hydrolase)